MKPLLLKQMRKSLSQEDERDILRYYRTTPTRALAARLGMCRATLCYHAHRLGLRKFSSAPPPDEPSEVDGIEIVPKLNCWGRPMPTGQKVERFAHGWNEGI